MAEHQMASGQFAAKVGRIGGVALALLKAAVGLMSGSIALFADAAHSFLHLLGSSAMIRTTRLAASRNRIYRYGKIEPVAAILISVVLLLAGFQLIIAAFQSLVSDASGPPGWPVFVVIAVSFLLQTVFYRISNSAARRLHNKALAIVEKRNLWLPPLMIALAGAGLALAGAVGNWPLLYLMDPLAGIMIALMIVKTGYQLVRESTYTVIEQYVVSEDTEELLREAQRVVGVIAIENLRAREYGHYIVVDLEISVNPQITVMEGHEIAKSVKHHLMHKFNHISDVVIHVSPYESEYPYKNNINADQAGYSSLLH